MKTSTDVGLVPSGVGVGFDDEHGARTLLGRKTEGEDPKKNLLALRAPLGRRDGP